MGIHIIIRKGEYRDSVVLMNISSQLQHSAGVQDALVVMGTESNKEVLDELQMLTPECTAATANDLIIAIKTENEDLVPKLVDKVWETAVKEYKGSDNNLSPKHNYSSFEDALLENKTSNLALISIPGEFVKREARKAINSGLDVFIFSSNVSLEDELSLKQLAMKTGHFVMGPDCGVGNINGIALALASIVQKGKVGIVGASGSGIQEVAALIELYGLGVSQAIGVGGHDLHPMIGGKMMLQGISFLAADPATEYIILIGKNPEKQVEKQIKDAVQYVNKPVIVCFLGADKDNWKDERVFFASTLDEAAKIVAALENQQIQILNKFDLPEAEIEQLVKTCQGKLLSSQKFIRGIFGAGTFCTQAQSILFALGEQVYSNIPIKNNYHLNSKSKEEGHVLIDIGEEQFTMGRAHPVIDLLQYRLAIKNLYTDPQVAILMFDVILGPGANPDPADYITRVLSEVGSETKTHPILIANVCGTEHDPQILHKQQEKLRNAGVIVMNSITQSVLLAARILGFDKIEKSYINPLSKYTPIKNSTIQESESPKQNNFAAPMEVINLGIASFGEALQNQGVNVHQIDWLPPADGDLRVLKCFDVIEEKEPELFRKISNANKKAYDIICSGKPVWTTVCKAGEIIPGFHKNLVLHTGPAIELDAMLPQHREGIIGGILFEGLAQTHDEALSLIRNGDIELAPGIDYCAPSAGMAPTTYSMPVIVVEDFENETKGFCPIYEGPSYDGLRWGVYNQAVADNWKWLSLKAGPMLKESLEKTDGINLRNIFARSFQMGDENHSRQLAASLLIFSDLAPSISLTKYSAQDISRMFDFLKKTERFAQSIEIAAATAVMSAIKNIPFCSLVTNMGGNGVEIGIKVSSLGEKWYTANSPLIKGSYINPNTTIDDTVPFSGDSCMLEAFGFGGLAAAAAPTVTILAGGCAQDAINRTRNMWKITMGKHPVYNIPALDMAGTPVGIDILKVVDTSIVPQSHAGIILRKGGQAGAGIANFPMECFTKAMLAFVNNLGEI